MSFQIGNAQIGVSFVGDTAGLQRALDQASGGVDQFGNKTKGALRGVATEAGNTGNAMDRLATGIKGAFIGGSVAVGLIAMKNNVMAATGAIIDAQVQLDRWRNGFAFGAGGMAAGAQEMAFVRAEAQRLGVDLQGSASQYMKLVAASRGSSLQGEKTREVFKAIAEASVVMGMGVDQSERSMMAVTQMMSKGKVMAEELRGQLGEHLPGAFSIAARAMGVTEVELNKLLETGQVYSTDFLPKFAAQLRKELAGSVEESTQSMQASLNRFSTAWLTFKQEIAKGGVGAAIGGEIRAVSSDLNVLSETLAASRQQGDGFWASLGDVSLVAAGRAGFGALSLVVNTANGAVNLLSGGLLDLNTNARFMPTAFKPAADQLVEITKKADAAQVELKRLQALDAQPMNGNYFKGAIAETQAYIATLRQAQADKQSLMGLQPGSAKPIGSVGSGDTALLRAQRAEYDLQAKAVAGFWAKNQTPAQKMNAELAAMRVSMGALFSPEIEAKIRANYEKPVRAAGAATSALKDAERERQAALKDLLSTQAKAAELTASAGQQYLKDADAVMKSNDQLRDEIALIGLDESARRALLMVKENEVLADRELLLIGLQNAGADATTITNLEREISLRRQRVDLLGQQAGALDSQAALEAGEALRKNEAEAWARTWDQVSQSFTDALMQGGRSVKDYLAGLFRTLVLRPILAPIGAAAAGVFGGAAQAGQGGGMGSALNLASMGNSLYGGLNTAGAFGGLFASNAAYGAAIGATSIGAGSQAAMLASQTGAFGLAGAAATSTAAAGAGAGAASTMAAIAPWLLGAVAVASLWKPLFGRKLKDSGIEGTFGGATGFEGNSFEYLKGGLFRSNKTNRSALDEATRAGFGNAFNSLRDQVGSFADSIGLQSEKLAGYTSTIKLSLKDLSPEDAQKKITEALQIQGNALADLVLTSGFARAGEESIETLSRLSTSITTVNGIFDTLGTTLLNASLTGADAASKLLDAFGGLEAMAQSTSAYFQNFYSEEERNTTANRQIGSALGAVGVAMPDAFASDALAQYRALVEAQDLSTDAGRTAYATLVQLSSGFAQVAGFAKTQADAVIAEAQRTADTMASLLAQRFDGLGSARFDLENQLLSLGGNSSEVARRVRERELADLTSGIGAEDAARITAAYDFNQSLRDQIKAQQDAAAATQAAAQAASQAAAAADQLRGAWQSLADSLMSEVQRIRGELVGGDSRGLAFVESQFAITTAQARAGDQEATKLLPELSRTLLTMAEASATTLQELQRYRAMTAGSLETTGQALAAQFGLTLPGFAVGTNFVPGDMTARIHEGERIVPAADNRALIAAVNGGGSQKLEGLVMQLVEENRAQAGEIVRLNLRMTRVLERWDGEGMPEERVLA